MNTGRSATKIFFTALVAVVVLIIFVYCILFFQVRSLENDSLYQPVGAYQMDIAALGVEEKFISSETGESINVAQKIVESDYIILFFHGNAGNVTYHTQYIDLFDSLEYSFVMIDYPGYGKSSGTPNQENVTAAARAAYDYVIEQTSFTSEQIILFGHSLGGAVAVDLAAEVEEAGLIVMSSFTSTHEVARDRYPSWLLNPRFFLKNKYQSIDLIVQSQSPVLLIHGDADTVLLPEYSQALFQAAAEPKELYIIEGAGHSDGIQVAGERVFAERIQAFIE